MSKSPVIQFLESVAEPPGVEEFQVALNDSVQAIVKLGEKKGFSFTAQELREAIAELMKEAPAPEDMSEQELDSVVGGTRLSTSSDLSQLSNTIHNYHAYHNYESFQDITTFWTR